MTEITSNDSKGAENIPPIIGAAMSRITSEPLPISCMIGSNPAIRVATVIPFGRTRSTAL